MLREGKAVSTGKSQRIIEIGSTTRLIESINCSWDCFWSNAFLLFFLQDFIRKYLFVLTYRFASCLDVAKCVFVFVSLFVYTSVCILGLFVCMNYSYGV